MRGCGRSSGDGSTPARSAISRTIRRAATDRDAARAAETSRRLIQDTIKSVRELAVELRPKALDDFGLAPAVERLAADVAYRTGTAVDVDVRVGEDRLPPETELTVFRVVQEVLGHIADAGGKDGAVRIVIERASADVRVLIERGGTDGRASSRGEQWVGLGSLRERVRLAGGRVSATSGSSGAVRVVLPL